MILTTRAIFIEFLLHVLALQPTNREVDDAAIFLFPTQQSSAKCKLDVRLVFCQTDMELLQFKE